MATEFICEVGPEQDDYTTGAAWETGTQCDYTSSATLVFAGTRTGTIDDDDTVTGATSSATGTVVHCTATQILIESISGTFQSGEQIQKDGATSNYFTTSDAGDSALAAGEAATTGNADSEFTIAGATTDATNYRIFRAAIGHEASQPWSTIRYRVSATGTTDPITVTEDYAQLRNIAVEYAGTSQYTYGIYVTSESNIYGVVIDGCIARQTNLTANCNGFYVAPAYVNTCTVQNCIAYGWTKDGFSAYAGIDDCNYLYCTSYGNGGKGFYSGNNRVDKCIGNIAYNNFGSDFDVLNANTFTYNFSEDDTAGTGTGCIRGVTDGKSPDFVSTTSGEEDFHLQSTSDAIDAGLGPGSDSDVPTTDFCKQSRHGNVCDIGAAQYIPEFAETVGPGQTGTAYTTAASWESGTQCTLTSDTTLVYTGTITGTIADNATVTLYRGGTSQSETATVVHATATQILLESISDTGDPQANDEWRVDASNKFAITDTGHNCTVAAVAASTGSADAALSVGGAGFSSVNYRSMRAASGQEATQPFPTSTYRISTATTHPFETTEPFRLSNIALEYTGTATYKYAIYTNPSVTCYYEIDGCVMRQTNTGTNCVGVYIGNAYCVSLIWNNIAYGFTGDGFDIHGRVDGNDLYNNTAYDCANGFDSGTDRVDKFINNLSWDNGTADFSSTLVSAANTFTYNFSKDDSAGNGTGCIQGDTDGETPDFVNTGSGTENLKLQSTSDAIDAGLGNGSDGDIPTEDFEGNARGTGSTCDIGAHEYTSTGTDGAATDEAELTDTAVGLITGYGAATDEAELTDTAAASKSLAEAAADEVELADLASAIKALVEAAVDEAEFSDSAVAAKTLAEDTADTAEFSDSASATVGRFVEATDGTELSDSTAASKTLDEAATDGIELTDAAVWSSEVVAAVTDGADFSDSALSTKTLSGAAIDGIELTDAIVALAEFMAAVADTTELTDSSAATKILSEAATDGVELTDASVWSTEIVAALVDGVELTDTSSTTASAYAAASEAVDLSDVVAAVKILSEAATDGVELTDASVWSTEIVVTVADGVELTDAVTVLQELFAESPDGVSVSDSATAAGTFSVAVADGTEVSDVAAAIASSGVAAVDGVSFTDSSNYGTEIVVTVADGIELSDVATAVVDFVGVSVDGVELTDTVDENSVLTVTVTDGAVAIDVAGGGGTTDAEASDIIVVTDSVLTSDIVGLVRALIEVRQGTVSVAIRKPGINANLGG